MAKAAKRRMAAKKAARPTYKARAGKKAPAGTPRAKLKETAGKALRGLGIGRGAVGFRKKRSAKQALKKAYEKRAYYLIRTNQLGQARKALRKKATVI